MTAHAIDFGTSNTVVARWNPVASAQETLRLSGLSAHQAGMPPLIPSLVYVENAIAGDVICGQRVRDRNFHITINDLATHKILIDDQIIGQIH